ncbi:hypothetical protein BV25DRAFT_1919209 [Artomyces pyxidatus]|uniref:Uncharacterized protein n=1 Tax=Artomyces pyxidatus TaxID=48021 RepID=A0ACB8SPT6_9AGAM|nr:hypothetical protein BV25DRAFT_1919209 [Artomyces pyxidatus]
MRDLEIISSDSEDDAVRATGVDSSEPSQAGEDEEMEVLSEEGYDAEGMGRPVKRLNIVQNALRDIMDSGLDLPRSCAVSLTYNSAYSPGLTIDGVGIVGLPLSAAAALHLRSELDSSRLRFANPHWEPWVLDTALPSVCTGLGITTKEAFPRCELSKLLLYETGQPFHPTRETGDSKSILATIMIVLPSQFEGGGVQHKVFDTSAVSAFATTALAWYTDVVHDVKPITRGFRLVLSYNVVRAATALVPRLLDLDGPMQALERVLRTWRHADRLCVREDLSPPKLAYILRHQYSQKSLSFDQLKGSDFALALGLRDASKKLGFRVALGDLSYTKRGHGEPRGPARHRHRRNSDYNVDDVYMTEVGEVDCLVQFVSGTTGEPLGNCHTLDFEEIMVDEDYFDKVPPDEKDFEDCYDGSGPLQCSYNRTLLLIWPDSQNAHVMTSLGDCEAAVASLSSVISTKPTSRDLDLVEIALSQRRPAAARAVADAALRWHDPDLWRRAVNSCYDGCNMDVFDEVRLINAYRAFGFQKVSVTLERIIANTRHIFACLELLNALQTHNHPMEPTADAPEDWIAARRARILSALQKPDERDVLPIVSSTWLLGGIEQLRNVVLPQLIAHHLHAEWWKMLIEEIQQVESSDKESRFNGWAQPVFDAAKPIFEKSILLFPRTADRFRFVDEVSSSTIQFAQWCEDQRANILANFGEPHLSDISSIVSTAHKLGGLTPLRDVVLPQLKTGKCRYDWWKAMIYELERAESVDAEHRYGGWAELVFPIVRPIFEEALSTTTSNTDRFRLIEKLEATAQSKVLFTNWCADRRQWAMESLATPLLTDIPVFMQFQKKQHKFLCDALLPKLRTVQFTADFWLPLLEELCLLSTTDEAALPEDWQQLVLDVISEPLHNSLTAFTTNEKRFQQLKSFARTVSSQKILCKFISDQEREVLNDLKPPTSQDIDRLVRALVTDPSYGPTNLLPQLLKLGCTPTCWKELIRNVHSQAAILLESNWTPEGVKTFIKGLVEAAISQAPIEAVSKPAPPPANSHPRTYTVSTAAPTSTIFIIVKDLVTLCIETGNVALAPLVFRKVFAVCRNQASVEHTLDPLFSEVQGVIKAHHIDPDVPPFSDFFRQAMTAYAVGLLGPKPSDQATSWKGALSPCNPHALRIEKSPAYTEIGVWKTRSAEGLRLLGTIGDEAMLQKLWSIQPGGLEMMKMALVGESILLAGSNSNATPDPSAGSTIAGTPRAASTPRQKTLARSPGLRDSTSTSVNNAPAALSVPQKRKKIAAEVDIDLTLDDE